MAPKAKPGGEEKLPSFWFPHSSEGYVLGEVLHQDASDNMHVRLHLPEGEKTANFHVTPARRTQHHHIQILPRLPMRVCAPMLSPLQASVAKPVNPKILDGVNDNTQLMHLHEPSLLFNLRYRYEKDLIYTYTGTIAL